MGRFNKMILDVAIIGGGLSGLSLAHGLLKENRNIAVFESRERFGGCLDDPAAPRSFGVSTPSG